MKVKTLVIATAAAASLAALSGCERPSEEGSSATRAPGSSSPVGRDTSRPQAPMAANSGTDSVAQGRNVPPSTPGAAADSGSAPPSGVAPAPSGGATLNDAMITAKVKSALIAETGVDGMKINVETEGGKVILKGEVPKTQIERVVQVARAVQGVQDVDNQLRARGDG